MNDIVSREHLKLARKMLEYKAVYEEARDLINIGAYVAGNNAQIDTSIRYIDAINGFLRQEIDAKVSLEESVAKMRMLLTGVA